MNNNFEYVKQSISAISRIQQDNRRLVEHIKECFNHLENGVKFVSTFLQGYADGLNIDTSNQNTHKTDYKTICYLSSLKDLEELNKQSEELAKKFANR